MNLSTAVTWSCWETVICRATSYSWFKVDQLQTRYLFRMKKAVSDVLLSQFRFQWTGLSWSVSQAYWLKMSKYTFSKTCLKHTKSRRISGRTWRRKIIKLFFSNQLINLWKWVILSKLHWITLKLSEVELKLGTSNYTKATSGCNIFLRRCLTESFIQSFTKLFVTNRRL